MYDPFESIPSSQEETQPVYRPMQPDDDEEATTVLQPIPISNSRAPLPRKQPVPKQKKRLGCCAWFIFVPVLLFLFAYFLLPIRTNILLLGIDRAPEGTDVSRSDTIILTSIIPLKPTVNMLSIPRDLWVTLPNGDANRINTAHFFAEAEETGSGPQATMQTIRSNFGITVNRYARIRFDGLKEIVDAMGGITITLNSPMSGYDPGEHRLNGDQALAFSRDRSSSDDFFRMQRGQIVIRSMLLELLKPATWTRYPEILSTASESIDTNIPTWQYPRLGLAVVRAVVFNQINAQTIDRDYVTPFTTDLGANVLLPNWDAINPLLKELFNE